jgi:hypothetical protein
VSIFNNKQAPRLRDTPDGVLLVGNGMKGFGLRPAGEGEEILAIKFTADNLTSNALRTITISFFVGDQGAPAHLFARESAQNLSVKNAEFVEKIQGQTLLSIVKDGKDSLKVEARFPHRPMWIFAIGIAAFLWKAN